MGKDNKNITPKQISKKDGYSLTRQWFDFASKNPDKIKPIHGILYLAMVEINNKLGWVETFGLPTLNTMQLIGVRNHKTYKKAFDDLVEWGFVKVIEKSQNQYTANVISLIKFPKAKGNDNLLTDAKENTKTDEECSGKIYRSTAQSNAHIIKQKENIKTNINQESKDEEKNIEEDLIKEENIEKDKKVDNEEKTQSEKIIIEGGKISYTGNAYEYLKDLQAGEILYTDELFRQVMHKTFLEDYHRDEQDEKELKRIA